MTATRLDGYNGPIEISLLNLPAGLSATNNRIPAGQDSATLLLSADVSAKLDQAAPLEVRGHARIGNRDVMHSANPEDRTKLIALVPKPDILMAAETKVGALALPRVTGAEETTWAPASRAEALRRLAPSSILQLPFISPGPALARMAELAQAVPVYRLELGTDLDGIPRRVAELLDRSGAG